MRIQVVLSQRPLLVALPPLHALQLVCIPAWRKSGERGVLVVWVLRVVCSHRDRRFSTSCLVVWDHYPSLLLPDLKSVHGSGDPLASQGRGRVLATFPWAAQGSDQTPTHWLHAT